MMSFHLLRAAAGASPVEKNMHTVHEAVGWVVLALVGAVLAVGVARTRLLHQKTEDELAATIDRSSMLRTLLRVHRSYLSQMYRRLFIEGLVGLCSNMYNRFEVAVVDGLNYAVAAATKKFSDILFEKAELSGIDRFNYLVSDSAVNLSSKFRKTHTGILSYNMTLVGFALIVFLTISLYFGGFLK